MSDPVDIYTEAPHLLREQNDDLRAENMKLKLYVDSCEAEVNKYKSWYKLSNEEYNNLHDKYDSLIRKVEGLLSE